MEKIDIKQNKPKKREPSALHDFQDCLFYIVQWTWGLPVNLIGGIGYFICKYICAMPSQKFGYARIVYVPWKGGGLSMGLFIFIKDDHKRKEWMYNTRIHEYGHTWQCLILGPLYYIVVAIPSFIWCNFFAGYRKKNNVPYSALYCEKWANAWGQKFSKMKQIHPEKL